MQRIVDCFLSYRILVVLIVIRPLFPEIHIRGDTVTKQCVPQRNAAGELRRLNSPGLLTSPSLLSSLTMSTLFTLSRLFILFAPISLRILQCQKGRYRRHSELISMRFRVVSSRSQTVWQAIHGALQGPRCRRLH
ncbi:hypothetical protein X977_4930 [Burkholderia pseudomallei MSHR7504]|nr:hypothetical protein X977_4930 [Burkholderia pseudomallei MSHR7504]